MNTTIFDTNAGIKITQTTEGWKTQSWWKGETEWCLLSDTANEVLVDLGKTEIIGMSIQNTIEFRKLVSDIISKRLQLAKAAQVTVDTAIAQGEVPVLTDEQMETGLKNMKAELIKSEGKVDRVNADECIEKMGKANAICILFGVKIVHETFNETSMESIVMALKMHGHVHFELHFPCGMKFETVMRCRDDIIHAYSYKL